MTTPDSRGSMDRGARILGRTVPAGRATLGEAVFFYGAAVLFWIIFLFAGTAMTLGAGLTAEDFGGLLALVMIFGPVVLAIVASSAALRWMRSRAVSPVVGCVAVPIITVVSIFVGWWLIPVLPGSRHD